MKKICFCSLFLTLSILSLAQPLWMRYNVISPQGDKIAFAYKGDIYVVDVDGGLARQITTSTAYDYNPVWSNDGKNIAFASDRYGNFDVFIVSSEGGQAKRITTNSAPEIPLAFSPDDKEIYFSAHLQKTHTNVQFTSAWLTELYKVSCNGGRPKLVTDATVCSVSFDADGESFLYYDRKGGENIWRKHHTSSVARDIVYYDAQNKTHTILTANVGEDRDPVFLPGYDKMAFLSERDGKNFNVYLSAVSDPDNVTQITDFPVHPVRFLSVSDNGMLCYGYQGEIYTQTVDGEPRKVEIEIISDYTEQIERGKFGRAGDFCITSDGKQIAFEARGEIFVTTDEYKTTKQITKTPQSECCPSFSPDGRSIAYMSERDGYYNIYVAKIVRDEEVNFAYSTLIEETPLFEDDGIERTTPQFSPDGKEIAYLENRNILKVINLDTKKVRAITDGSKHIGNDANHEFSYCWSPDSKWFAIELITNMRSPYSDVAVVSASGDKIIYNITNDGYIAGGPQWALDGNAVIFYSNRYGMRSHASWGSQNDAFIAFVNQDAYDKFRLSKEDYDLLQQEKNLMETLSGNKKEKKDKKKEVKKAIVVEPERIDERIIRLTPMSSRLSGMVMSANGEKLYFLSSFEKGYDLWELDVREKSTKILKKLGGGGAVLEINDKGDVYVLSGGNLQKIDANGKSKHVEYDATMELDRAAEREYMFNHIFLQQSKRFFMPGANGADFEKIKNDYYPFLKHINNSYDFVELMSEILGELNVSHTGARMYGNGKDGDATAQLGLLFDTYYEGDGLKVAEVLEYGPFDVENTKMRKGVVIEKIDGVEVSADMDYYPLLNKKSGKMVLLSLFDPLEKNRWDEVVKPISNGKQNELMYKRWVKHNAEVVDSLSGGRLGYVHIRSMGDQSYRDVYADILGKYNLRDGVVIDTRFNGGGRLHEDIEVLFSGEKYLEQVIRDSVVCVMPSRRYVKPSVMIIGEANYSNAHGTPWVYKYKKIGKLVGMPVPGTMSSVTWETLQDENLYFGLPVVGYRTEDGVYLENTQLEPDVKVRNTVEELTRGVDEQLNAAVRVLLEELEDFHYWGK